MSVMAMSVRGVTSPSMLKAVRLSRTATLKDVHPRYASFPIRPARLSPTRCQNSTTPSAPAFSIMSSIREASATSIMGGLGTWTSHERAEDLLEVGAPFLLRLRRNRVALDLPEAVDEFRQEPVPVRGGHVRRGRPDLVVGHRDDLLERPRPDEGAELRLQVLGDLLVLLELLRLAEFLDEQDAREPLQLPRDGLVIGGEDTAVVCEEHRDVEIALLAGSPQLRVEEVLQVADRVGPHRLVVLARVGHLAAPLQPVRREEHLEDFLRGVLVVPALLHLPDPLDDARGGLHRLGRPEGFLERLRIAPALLLGDVGRTRPDDDADATREEVRVHALAVVRAAHLQQLEGAVEGATNRVILEMDRAVRKVDRQEHVLPDRLAGLGMLFDRAEHDAEFLEGVEQFPDQLPLLQLLRGRPDHGGHRVDHDAGPDVVVRPGLDELRQLLLDHLLEIAALEVDEEKRFLVVLAQVESHEVRLAHDLLRRLLEGHVQGLLALLDAFHQELDREGRLPRAA